MNICSRQCKNQEGSLYYKCGESLLCKDTTRVNTFPAETEINRGKNRMRIKETGPLTNKTPEEFQKLINDNITFPYFLVKKEFGKKVPPNQWDDLVSAATAGMIYAATKYDLSKQDKCKFITYASNWIRYYVNEQIKDLYPVRTNQNFCRKKNMIDRSIAKYKAENDGKEPSIEWISNETGLSIDTIKTAQAVCINESGKYFSFMSIDFNANSDEKSVQTADKISLKCLDKIKGGALSDENRRDLEEVLENLKKRVSSDEYNLFLEYYLNQTSKAKLSVKFPHIKDITTALKKCLKICREVANS